MKMLDFESMSKKKRDLYECMWGSTEFDFPVEKTVYRGAITSNSYTFSDTSAEEEDVCRARLAKIFKIANSDLFKQKFSQSISGSGQELKRIATVHSSSLCTLLFFYNVSEVNPYIMEIEEEEYVFTYSCFEYQNKVIEGRNPSNMDVVLVGTHKNTGMPVVFFVESKFSEYYERTGKQLEVAAEYLSNKYSEPIYRSNCLWDMKLHIVEQPGNTNFVLISDDVCYVEGIKQMISHYVGVRNFCDNPAKNDKVIANAISNGARILLGEILFTKGIGQLPIGNGKNSFDSYQEKYHLLAKAMNNQLLIDGKSNQIIVLSDILSYSQFQSSSCIKEEQIKRFYFEMGKNE